MFDTITTNEGIGLLGMWDVVECPSVFFENVFSYIVWIVDGDKLTNPVHHVDVLFVGNGLQIEVVIGYVKAETNFVGDGCFGTTQTKQAKDHGNK